MRAFHFLLTLIGTCLAVPLYAGDDDLLPPLQNTEEVWMAVGDRTLDKQRGGFDVGGLLVSFGITRAVYVNGGLVTQTTLNFGELSQLTPAQAAQLNSQLAAVNVVQIGPGNTFSPGAMGTGSGTATSSSTGTGAGAATEVGTIVGTVIQNTLNNQQITNETVINAQSNALSMIKNLNALNTLHDNLIRSINGR